MNKLVAGTIQALEFQAEQAKAEISFDELPNCMGDPTLVGQVFTNLIDNAIKYRNLERPCRIAITGHVENGRAVYSVQDNGIGIAPEHQHRVFELFHRLDPKKTQGDGLGLTIAQRILERQHGRIWVESQAGNGTNFFISLPVSTSPIVN